MIVLIPLLGLFLFGMGWAVFITLKKGIPCPACGRKFKGAGKKPQCYKCGTKLFKHKNGEYMVRN